MTDCTEEEMNGLLAATGASSSDGLARAEHLIGLYPADARLHFLRGSLLVSAGRPIEAHASLSRAVALAPDFLVARFQLGFFELSSGEPARALETWQPLTTLPEAHHLALFVSGLTHLIHDRFADAILYLRQGIAANAENPPLSHDMQLIIDQCGTLAGNSGATDVPDEASATSFLLGQLDRRGTTH